MAASPLLATIFTFASNFAPKGYAFCSGQLLPIQQYTAIFSLIGTTYGGNGINNFSLPDFRGRSAVGAGQGPGLSAYVLGQVTGQESATLTTTTLPTHSHVATASATAAVFAGGTADTTAPASAYPAATPVGTRPELYSTASTALTMAPAMVSTVSVTNASTGGGQAFSVLNPRLAVSYIIALQGIFPSRN